MQCDSWIKVMINTIGLEKVAEGESTAFLRERSTWFQAFAQPSNTVILIRIHKALNWFIYINVSIACFTLQVIWWVIGIGPHRLGTFWIAIKAIVLEWPVRVASVDLIWTIQAYARKGTKALIDLVIWRKLFRLPDDKFWLTFSPLLWKVFLEMEDGAAFLY